MQFIHLKKLKFSKLKLNTYLTSIRCLLLFVIFTTVTFYQFNSNMTIAAPIDIADAPLDVQLQATAPNIMFGIDDSGSMDWEIMTDEEVGLFEIGNKDYEYVYDDPGDQLYSSGTYSDNISGDNRLYWKSQYHAYNVMFYNPAVNYVPWHSAHLPAAPSRPE